MLDVARNGINSVLILDDVAPEVVSGNVACNEIARVNHRGIVSRCLIHVGHPLTELQVPLLSLPILAQLSPEEK